MNSHTGVSLQSAETLARLCNPYFDLSEWNANPILISVETTDFPIENITFPSVTICREDNDQNCFEFVSKIFDFAEFPCFDEGQVYSRD